MTSVPPAALRVSGLKKTFRLGFFRKEIPAVVNGTFTVEPGETFGLIGPNGAGKTTVMKMVLGLIRPDEGSAEIFGTGVADRRARRRVGFLPAPPNFLDYLKPAELLSYFGDLYGMSHKEQARRIPEMIDLVGLNDATEKQLRKFSKGMLQRVGVAQALLHDPDLVILDEPMSGLDPMGRKDVRDIMLSLKERGKTVLFSSHILSDVEQVCDRVAIIIKGDVKRVATVAELARGDERSVEVLIKSAEDVAAWPLAPSTAKWLGAERWLVRAPDNAEAQRVLMQAMERGARVLAVSPDRQNLEHAMLEAAGTPDGVAQGPEATS